MQHEHHGNQRDDERNKDGIGSTKEEIAFEHLGHPPHRILADQDRRDESHVSPHEKTKEQTAGALGPIQPRGPVTFSRPSIQSNTGNDIDFIVHWSSLSTIQFRENKGLTDFDRSKRAPPIASFQHGVLESRSTRMSSDASLRNWMPAIHAGMTRSTLFILWSERKLIVICLAPSSLCDQKQPGR